MESNSIIQIRDAKETLYHVDSALDLRIYDPGSYRKAAELSIALTQRAKNIETWYEPHVKRAHDNHKMIIADKKLHLKPVEDALFKLKLRMSAYSLQENRKAEEESRRIAEQLRKDEEARRLIDAEELESMAEAAGIDASDDVQALLDEPLPHFEVAIAPETPNVSGVYEQERWKWKVENMDLIPREYMIPDEKAIGAMVRARKGMTKLPGIVVWAETNTVVRGGR
jgi:hypothetical protein